MAGLKGIPASHASICYMLFSRVYAARVTVLWTLTVLLALGLVLRGFVDQFCEHCRQQDLQRARLLTEHGGDILRRDEDGIPERSSNSCLSVSFAPPGSQELVALPSYPGSGNTWLRHLMEHSTGIYSGSVYKDKKLYSGGFRGEQEDYRNRTVLGVKMHRCNRKELKSFQASIFLIRNPYNAMIAEWHRYLTTKHITTADRETFKTKEWEEFVEEESSHWERMMSNCLRETPRTHAVFYERLQTDLLAELAQIHRFLRVPIDLERLQCTRRNAEGNFHRTAHIDFDPFTFAMVARINDRIDRAAAVLAERTGLTFPDGYKKDLTS